MTQLEDYAVWLPPVPHGVYFVLRHAMSAVACGSSHVVTKCALVNAGDVLGHFRDQSPGSTSTVRAEMVAPFAGKIVFQGLKDFAEVWDSHEAWPQFNSSPSLNVLVAIQPALGQSTAGSSQRRTVRSSRRFAGHVT